MQQPVLHRFSSSSEKKKSNSIGICFPRNRIKFSPSLHFFTMKNGCTKYEFYCNAEKHFHYPHFFCRKLDYCDAENHFHNPQFFHGKHDIESFLCFLYTQNQARPINDPCLRKVSPSTLEVKFSSSRGNSN